MDMLKVERDTAGDVVKSINSYIKEFEVVDTKPNTLLISRTLLQNLEKYFPYLIKGSLFIYNNVTLNIVITNKDMVGVALSFNTDTLYLDIKNENS